MTCSNCGGPLRVDCTKGVCQRNAECKRIAHTGRYKAKPIKGTCKGCGIALRRPNKYGYCNTTRTCRSEYAKAAGREHQATLKANLSDAKRRAKKLAIPFDLTLDTLPLLPESCPVLGIKLEKHSGSGGPKPNSPTLDRIVPSKGYVPGNVHWISHRANAIKRDATPEELRKVADYFWELNERLNEE